jgi:hypothetical protein
MLVHCNTTEILVIFQIDQDLETSLTLFLNVSRQFPDVSSPLWKGTRYRSVKRDTFEEI